MHHVHRLEFGKSTLGSSTLRVSRGSFSGNSVASTPPSAIPPAPRVGVESNALEFPRREDARGASNEDPTSAVVRNSSGAFNFSGRADGGPYSSRPGNGSAGTVSPSEGESLTRVRSTDLPAFSQSLCSCGPQLVWNSSRARARGS